MAADQASRLLHQLRTCGLLRDHPTITDGALLERFLVQRDEAAFASLVRRLGPMVLGVCRRVLVNRHDAEDAFQAAFLVLVRKATSIRPRERVGHWLYGVAYRTAMKAKTMAARRRLKEREAGEMRRWDAGAVEVADWRPVLDEELSRLPDRYRAAVVLCDLEGKSRREAARELGWREGTLSGRLARARHLLARRLAHRGVVPSAGVLIGFMAAAEAKALVPAPLIRETIQAGTLLAV